MLDKFFIRGRSLFLWIPRFGALGLCLHLPAPEANWNIWRAWIPSSSTSDACLDWSSWQAGCEGFWMKVLSRSHTWRCPTGRFTCTSVLQPSLVTSHLPWLPSRVQGIAGFHGTRRGQWCIPGSCCITQCPVPSCRTIEPLLPEVFYAPRRNISLMPDSPPSQVWWFSSLSVVSRRWWLLWWQVVCWVGCGRAQVTLILMMKNYLLF